MSVYQRGPDGRYRHHKKETPLNGELAELQEVETRGLYQF